MKKRNSENSKHTTQKKYKSLESIWDNHTFKFSLLILRAELDDKSTHSSLWAKVQIEKESSSSRTLVKTSKYYCDQGRVTWNQFFFLSHVDQSDYISISLSNGKTLGSALLFQLQSVHPRDEVIDKWFTLSSNRGKGDTVVGRIHLRYSFSDSTQVIPHMPDVWKNDYNYDYFDRQFEGQIKAGDLIYYSSYGIIPTLLKVNMNIPFSSVGLVLNLKDKWTHKDALYVVELTRNTEKMLDAFTDKPDNGLNIFPLFERIHQFNGSSIWWSKLRTRFSKREYANMINKISIVMQHIKNLDSNRDQILGSNILSGMLPEYRISYPQIIPFLHSFGIGQLFTELYELFCADLISSFIENITEYSRKETRPCTIEQLVNMEFYDPPRIMKVRSHYISPDMNPEKFVNDTGMMTYPRECIHPTLKRLSEQVLQSIQDAQFDSTKYAYDLSKRIPKINQIYLNSGKNLIDEDIFQIMKTGSLFLYFSGKEKPRKLLMVLNSDHTVLHFAGKQIKIENIAEIRLGYYTPSFTKNTHASQNMEKLAFSIIYNSDPKSKAYDSIDVICLTEYDYQYWREGIDMLMNQRYNHTLIEVKKIFQRNRQREIGFIQAQKILKHLNVHSNKKYLKELIRHADSDNNGMINSQEFVSVLRVLKSRPSIKNVFEQYSENEMMSPEHLLHFIQEQQKDTVSLNECHRIIAHFSNGGTHLSLFDFEEYLTSSANHLMKPSEQYISQDMNHPLTHYWIASSHNTYLEGHQLTGISSIEQYIKVLKSGCRCLELDCWDGKDGEPIITHGFTLTTKVKFLDVIKVITKYAFYTNPFPLILSLENHCSVQQQDIIAQIMIQYFNSNLLLPTDRPDGEYLPSPVELKGKILIKGKMLNRIDDMFKNSIDKSDEEIELEEDKLQIEYTEKISENLSKITFLKAVKFSTERSTTHRTDLISRKQTMGNVII
eukprot:TRINITY_DN4833_c0_g2_i5.p1 TRINITY_DN4833_c0_g2~~TRINITY_DN4833_c0_g2_i5.p1  ORF type:complete len:946 (-),score=170.47 TRINITY_DN4833_c0_g2_i5:588-3425(-)